MSRRKAINYKKDKTTSISLLKRHLTFSELSSILLFSLCSNPFCIAWVLHQDFSYLDLSSYSNGTSCPVEADFFSRLVENGATESCSDHVSPIVMEDDIQTRQVAAKNVVRNITSSINGIWKVNDKLATALILTLSEHGKYFKFQLCPGYYLSNLCFIVTVF